MNDEDNAILYVVVQHTKKFQMFILFCYKQRDENEYVESAKKK